VSDPRDDLRLLEGVQLRDAGAFRGLYERYLPRVYGFVDRRLREPALTEEVVTDVFFEIWRSAPGFRGASRVSTWIFGIATFKCREADRNRRRLKRRSVVAAPAEVLHRVADAHDAAATLEARDELRWLRHRIDALPEGQRRIVELAILEGRDPDEIAGALGISRGTVKSRLSRARRELRGRPGRGRPEARPR
jgi:RNA polymerase sigma-70 factor (ECF subfamily)